MLRLSDECQASAGSDLGVPGWYWVLKQVANCAFTDGRNQVGHIQSRLVSEKLLLRE